MIIYIIYLETFRSQVLFSQRFQEIFYPSHQVTKSRRKLPQVTIALLLLADILEFYTCRVYQTRLLPCHTHTGEVNATSHSLPQVLGTDFVLRPFLLRECVLRVVYCFCKYVSLSSTNKALSTLVWFCTVSRPYQMFVKTK